MIVTGNPLDGWLSLSRTGEPRAQPNTEGLVPAGVYFFHATTDTGSKSESDATFPSFPTWPFPHGRIPVLWLQAALMLDEEVQIYWINALLLPSLCAFRGDTIGDDSQDCGQHCCERTIDPVQRLFHFRSCR